MKKKAMQRQTQAMLAPEVAQAGFDEVLGLIEAARTHAVASVNTALIDLYWSIGKRISRKIAMDGWMDGGRELLRHWLITFAKACPMFAAFPRRISGGCASFLTPTRLTQNSQQC